MLGLHSGVREGVVLGGLRWVRFDFLKDCGFGGSLDCQVMSVVMVGIVCSWVRDCIFAMYGVDMFDKRWNFLRCI